MQVRAAEKCKRAHYCFGCFYCYCLYEKRGDPKVGDWFKLNLGGVLINREKVIYPFLPILPQYTELNQFSSLLTEQFNKNYQN